MDYINVIKDEFNSKHFSLTMANMIISDVVEEYSPEKVHLDIKNTLERAADEGIDHISCVISTGMSDVIYALESNGVRLIDTLITYEFIRGKSVLSPINHKVEIGDCTENDIDELCMLAKAAYQIDRYHKDRTLDRSLCDSYYENWTRNCFNGLADRMIVARFEGRPVGYMPLKLHPESLEMRMIISAVSEKHRSLGIFTSMSHESIRYMLDECSGKANTQFAGTYIDNIAVQRAFIRLGYTLNSSKYVFQKALRRHE